MLQCKQILINNEDINFTSKVLIEFRSYWIFSPSAAANGSR